MCRITLTSQTLILTVWCHFAPTQTITGRSCSDPRTGHVRQHGTSTRSAPEYARRGGSTDAGKALRALAAPPRRHPAPLHPLQGSCASSRAARRRQHGLPGASSSTKNPLRYLSDRTGDHARVKRQRDAEARMAAPARTSAGHAGGARTPMRFFLTTSPIHGKMRALFSVASYTQRPRVSVPLFRSGLHTVPRPTPAPGRGSTHNTF